MTSTMLYILIVVSLLFFFSSRRRHTSCALVTGVQTCALPIFKLPRPMLHSHDLDFSFSGLKTAVLTQLRKLERDGPPTDEQRADLEIGRASCRERVCQYV